MYVYMLDMRVCMWHNGNDIFLPLLNGSTAKHRIDSLAQRRSVFFYIFHYSRLFRLFPSVFLLFAASHNLCRAIDKLDTVTGIIPVLVPTIRIDCASLFRSASFTHSRFFRSEFLVLILALLVLCVFLHIDLSWMIWIMRWKRTFHFTSSCSVLHLLAGLLCMYLTCAVSENDKSEPSCMAFRALCCVHCLCCYSVDVLFFCSCVYISLFFSSFYTTCRELFFSHHFTAIFSLCFFFCLRSLTCFGTTAFNINTGRSGTMNSVYRLLSIR